MGYGDLDPVNEILNRVGWDEVTAVKEGNVLQANSDEFTRPGPRLAEAVKTLYDFVHVEYFFGKADTYEKNNLS